LNARSVTGSKYVPFLCIKAAFLIQKVLFDLLPYITSSFALTTVHPLSVCPAFPLNTSQQFHAARILDREQASSNVSCGMCGGGRLLLSCSNHIARGRMNGIRPLAMKTPQNSVTFSLHPLSKSTILFTEFPKGSLCMNQRGWYPSQRYQPRQRYRSCRKTPCFSYGAIRRSPCVYAWGVITSPALMTPC